MTINSGGHKFNPTRWNKRATKQFDQFNKMVDYMDGLKAQGLQRDVDFKFKREVEPDFWL